MKRTAKAFWHGDLKSGAGHLSTQSGVLNETQYSFNTRFADGIGSNPEELLAAAHAGCFTMAIAYALSQQGFTPGELNTNAVVTLDMAKGGISQINLELQATAIEGVSAEEFEKQAFLAKENCIISKALAGIQIELTVNYH
ncbi:OsmC family peroxiredoxin [Pedobacter sp. UBA5917]|jgi:osmotically inducible protein OsmC|uniref:OsmC family peroxiredoxin n=1 Tax=Pedobacter sp. UBA5917 TaxID=1947061 RepID=UPI0025CE415E|nr:OsmC family peroxiredoxin [Pedobacter sp. UBA5917]